MTPDPLADAPLVSVIVPSYNHARYVIDCLESVATDPYPAKELVIIDDGSTDGSPEIIDAWRRRTTIPGLAVRFMARENRGLATTLNELLSLATGPYVIPLASDDQLVRGGIAARVDFLQSNPQLQAVFGDCDVMDADGNRIQPSGLSDLHGVRKERLMRNLRAEIVGNWGVPGPVLMSTKRGLIAIGGYAPELIAEDWNIYLGLVSRGWLGFVDAMVGRYRLHGENTMLRPERQKAIYSDLYYTARSHLSGFGLVDRWRLLQQMCSIRATLASLSGRFGPWLAWRLAAGGLKVPLLAFDAFMRRVHNG